MKHAIFVAGALCLGLSACASPNAGNPNGAEYAGMPRSVYDTAANPPHINGTVSYNPNAPLPSAMEPAMGTSGSTMPAPAGSRPR